MVVLLTGGTSWLFDFHARMRAIQQRAELS
jgi:hypothetical protein